MLIEIRDEVDTVLGKVQFQLLADTEWVRRRTEAIDFVGARTLQRRITFDVSCAQVGAVWSEVDLDTSQSNDRPPESIDATTRRYPLPLIMLRKELLTGFDLRDESGRSVPLATRDEDAYLSWCVMSHQLSVLGIVVPAGSEVERHIRSIIHDFPNPEDQPGDTELASWRVGESWGEDDRRLWREILGHEAAASLLRDLTFTFPLVASVPLTDGPRLLKISYREDFDPSGVLRSWRPKIFAVEAPAVGWSRSSHIQVTAPDGVEIEDVALMRVGDLKAPGVPPHQSEFYRYKVTEPGAQVYAGRVERANYVVVLLMHLRTRGILRAAWLTSLFSLAVLLGVMALTGSLLAPVDGSAGRNVGAMAALLLVVPSTLNVYMVRPTEHQLVSAALLRVRFLLALSALLTFVLAAALVLEVGPVVVILIAASGAFFAALSVAQSSAMVFSNWWLGRMERENFGRSLEDVIDVLNVTPS